MLNYYVSINTWSYWFPQLIFVWQYDEKKVKDLTQSYEKKPFQPQKKIQKANWQHKTLPKTCIIQRLQTYLGRSVGVTKATKLVSLNRFTTSQPSH